MKWLPWLVGVLLLLAPKVVRAEQGHLWVELSNTRYPKVLVNGSHWSAIRYADRGRRVIIKGLPTDATSTVKLTPIYRGLVPQTLKTTKGDFKRTRVRKSRHLWIAKADVRFARSKATKRPAKRPGQL